MATHSSILAQKILWTEESGWLQSMWSQRDGHGWAHMPSVDYGTVVLEGAFPLRYFAQNSDV